MKMTLSEALRDDLVALEVGWLCLLPTKDASGRQLIVMEPSRHKREGYTTKSMVRPIVVTTNLLRRCRILLMVLCIFETAPGCLVRH